MFEVLVHKYQGMVFALARRYLGSRYPDLDDVAQKVFLRVYRSSGTYQPKAKVKTWLYSVTVNACLNEIRRLQSQKNRAVNSFTAIFGDGDESPRAFEDAASPSPGDDLDSDAIRLRVQAAVDLLPEQQRLALLLTRFHGCSYDDTAAAMETTVPAVKSLLTRAREGLRQRLGDLVEQGPGLVSSGPGSASGGKAASGGNS